MRTTFTPRKAYTSTVILLTLSAIRGNKYLPISLCAPQVAQTTLDLPPQFLGSSNIKNHSINDNEEEDDDDGDLVEDFEEDNEDTEVTSPNDVVVGKEGRINRYQNITCFSSLPSYNAPLYASVLRSCRYLSSLGRIPCLQNSEYPGGCSVLTNDGDAYVVVCGLAEVGATCKVTAEYAKMVASVCKVGDVTGGYVYVESRGGEGGGEGGGGGMGLKDGMSGYGGYEQGDGWGVHVLRIVEKEDGGIEQDGYGIG